MKKNGEYIMDLRNEKDLIFDQLDEKIRNDLREY